MLVRYLPVIMLCSLLGACNGYVSLGSLIGSASSTGGTLSELPGGQSIVLFDNGHDSLTLAANGPFVFGGLVPSDGSYVMTISTQLASTDCVMMNDGGRVNGNANDMQATCQLR